MLFYKIVKNFAKFLLFLIYRIEIEGEEHIPEEDKVIVSSNHYSFMDPIVIGALSPRKVNFMGKEELFSNRFFASALDKLGVFPVKRGGSDISAIKTALKILNSGEVFGIFPEGTRSKPGETLKAKPGSAMIAIKTQSPVIPVAITGDYKPFGKIKITIGEPVDLSDYYGKKISTDEYQRLSQNILDKIRELMV